MDDFLLVMIANGRSRTPCSDEASVAGHIANVGHFVLTGRSPAPPGRQPTTRYCHLMRGIGRRKAVSQAVRVAQRQAGAMNVLDADRYSSEMTDAEAGGRETATNRDMAPAIGYKLE